MSDTITEAEPIKDTNAVHSSEKIRSLRVAIDAKLHEKGIYEQIRDLVHLKSSSTTLSNENSERQLNSEGDLAEDEEAARLKEEKLIHDVLESEVVQQLLATVRSMDIAPPTPEDIKSTNHDDAEAESDLVLENERDVFLYLRLSGGKAFVDQLVELEHDSSNNDHEVDVGLDEQRCPVGSVVTFFRLNVAFQKQRQTSRDIRCCVDPPFDEHFLSCLLLLELESC